MIFWFHLDFQGCRFVICAKTSRVFTVIDDLMGNHLGYVVVVWALEHVFF